MSFILDALKKSESDRQRQGGPALFEVKVAPPRHALPPWAVAIAVMFVANLAVVGWLLLRRAAAPAQAAARAPAPTRTEAAPGPAPASAPASAPAAAAPAVVALDRPAVAASPAVAPAVHGVVTAPSGPASEASSNPDDLAPAAEPPPSGVLGRVRRGTDAGVPLYQELAATPGSQLPQLRLDLHAYAERAGDRWVLINMHKLHEGDSLEGARLERITPDGAVLSYRGTQFLLTRE
jgi:general secretion pathway protein B